MQPQINADASRYKDEGERRTWTENEGQSRGQSPISKERSVVSPRFPVSSCLLFLAVWQLGGERTCLVRFHCGFVLMRSSGSRRLDCHDETVEPARIEKNQ